MSSPDDLDPRQSIIDFPFFKRPYRRIENPSEPDANLPQRTIVKSIYDRYEVKEQKKTDILWVIDNSCSMAEEREKVSQNLDAFIADFSKHQIDFQMAVISTHTNDSLFYGEPPILKWNDPALEPQFSQRIRMETECGYAPALYSAMRALSEPRKSGHNKGFLREDSFLTMIIISDANEDDRMTSQAYYSFFTGLKPGAPYQVTISSIVGDVPGGCRSDTGDAEPGEQYVELSQMTRGFTESICASDFSETLGRIGKNLDEYIRSFPLSKVPHPKFEIVVKVNSRIIPRDPVSGWTYNSVLNVIQFPGSYHPKPGDRVEITYKGYV